MGATINSTGGVSAIVSYKNLGVSVSYHDISVDAQLTFPTRLIVEVVTPADRPYKAFTKTRRDSTRGFSERVRKGFTKRAADSVVMEDDADIDFFLGKVLNDIPLMSDDKIISLAKALVDLASVSDAASPHLTKALQDSNITPEDIETLEAHKGLFDSVETPDHIYAVRLFVRAFVEDLLPSDFYTSTFTKAPFNLEVAAGDSDTYSFEKLMGESVVMIDNMDGDIQYQVVKVIGELISSPSDQLVTSVEVAKSEEILTSSSGVAFTTSYADISYFAADYVGVSSTF